MNYHIAMTQYTVWWYIYTTLYNYATNKWGVIVEHHFFTIHFTQDQKWDDSWIVTMESIFKLYKSVVKNVGICTTHLFVWLIIYSPE